MTDSLRDQLLNLGFKTPPAPERKPAGGKPGAGKGAHGRPAPGRGAQDRPATGKGAPGGRPHKGSRPDTGPRKPSAAPPRSGPMDLGKAYALRAQHEKQERIDAEQRKQDEARLRREARARLDELLQGKALNDAAADIARHFEYGGKIKRVYVTAAQLKALNAGELGVLQVNGRYLLVAAAVLAEAEQVFAPSVALKVDPAAPVQDDPYADPRYQVPDDLVW